MRQMVKVLEAFSVCLLALVGIVALHLSEAATGEAAPEPDSLEAREARANTAFKGKSIKELVKAGGNPDKVESQGHLAAEVREGTEDYVAAFTPWDMEMADMGYLDPSIHCET